MSLDRFHPAVVAWFRSVFAAPTEAQNQAWPAIQSGRNALIAAPTGSGKTLAAFLAAIDSLVRRGIEHGLADETSIVYVSPLKALSNDIRINLEAPLAGIRAELKRLGLADVEIRSFVRTGDTPQAARGQMRKRPPHIVVTTPESLYILLGSESGRQMLATTRTVIVDEIHAIAASKRGSHLALSLERLESLTGHGLVRVGLSATQKPIEEVARFLVGNANINSDGQANCVIVDAGYTRPRDLAIEVPLSPLEAVMSNEVWEEVYDRLTELIHEHRTTLIFVNTRRLAERAARHLSERIGKEAVTAHHGSLAKEQRFDAEQRLKRGELKALVATASLELGIDIGDVDLVCQLSSPRSIAAWLQRVGRSGHAVGETPKGRLFPQSRDDLIECAAILDSVRRGELDQLSIPQKPLDVLAQQIVAEVACREWNTDDLLGLFRRAYPYREVTAEEYAAVVNMLAEGFSTRFGARYAWLHRDAVNRVLNGRRGARLTAITSGGTIPDNADYDVVLEPQAQFIGTINEDFAVESLAGDIFQLGNNSYRILRVERGRVRVEDAHGAAPTMPFWLGEAPGRSDELSFAVSRLREEIAARLDSGGHDAALHWLIDEAGVAAPAAQQIVDYLAMAKTALGLLPTQRNLVMERFFDESGGTQLVIHSPLGSRLNRAWGLALRKRFCRKFNFELQAAATEDSIVLSLSTSHSFPLDEVAHYLSSASVRDVLVQALLDAPMFAARWRWNAAIALALPRFRAGKKVPAPLMRMNAEDLIAAVFPDQLACGENLPAEREIPNHPLVNQTIHDCLHEAMDLDGLIRLLQALERGEIQVTARDVTEPSPLAMEVLSARPYAYLDDAPLEERRTQAVMGRRWLDPASATDIGRLDAEAIARVREEAWPQAQSVDELHDALMGLAFISDAEIRAQENWRPSLDILAADKRATRLSPPPRPGRVSERGAAEELKFSDNGPVNDSPSSQPSAREEEETALWIAAERLPQFTAVFTDAKLDPLISVPAEFAAKIWPREEAVTEIIRSRLTGLGPVTTQALAESLGLPTFDIDIALASLESEGYVMRGRFTHDTRETEWCERRLLARIHRYTVKRLRQEIQPVAAHDFMRFLFEWQHVSPTAQMEGPDALAAIIAQLEGFEAPAAAWETEILPTRVKGYEFTWLDDLCLAGRIVWTRLSAPASRAISATANSSDSLADRFAHLPAPSATRTPSPVRRSADDNANSSDSLADRFAHLPAPSATRTPSPVRTTPIALLQRKNMAQWTALAGGEAALPFSSRAQAVADYLARHGASFFDELLEGARLLRSQLEEALAELVALGLVNADSFAGLRVLLAPADKRPSNRRGRRRPLLSMEDAGRWALIRRKANVPANASTHPEVIEHIARTLLKRYGVVFWRMLAREARWLPPWRELLRVYHRLENRGEIRGGRFVEGGSGEQFALPEAVALLRKVRRQEASGAMICLSGADPLNLIGSAIPGSKVPALTGARVLFLDGVPIATLVAGEATFFNAMSPADQWAAKNLLLRGPAGVASASSTSSVAP